MKFFGRVVLWVMRLQLLRIEADGCAENCEKLTNPGGVGGPGGSGDEIAVGVGVIEGLAGRNELTTGELDLGAAGGVGAELAAFHHDAGGSEELCAVTDGGDRFFRGGEMADDIEYARRQAK